MKRILPACAVLIAAATLIFTITDSRPQAPAHADADQPIPGGVRVFVTFTDDFDGDGSVRDEAEERTDEDAFVQAHSGRVRHRYQLIAPVALEVPLNELVSLARDSHVLRIEADSAVVATDAEMDNSWGVQRIGSQAAHDLGIYGTGVKVAIIDTGINATHVDLDANYNPSCSYDFVSNDANPADDHGHGTHVSGTVAAEDNGIGVVGVAPGATLCEYKVLDASGGGSYSAVIAALDRAVQDGARVASLSLGSIGNPGSTVEQAFDNAYAAGVFIVAAAGNSGDCAGTAEIIGYPAKFASAVGVAATDISNTRACFSSTGADVEIAAPGVSVNSTMIGSSTAYAAWSGTSMATPHVSGLAALLFSCNPSLTAPQVRSIINSTALDLDSPLAAGVADGRDTWYGYGLAQVQPALTAAGCGAGAPTPTATEPAAATATRTATRTPTRTNTPVPPASTATPTRTNTPVPTATRTATRTNTPVPPASTATDTPTPTNTPIPPASTATPTSTPTPPLSTPTPTQTPTPAATHTATHTPTPTGPAAAPPSGADLYFSVTSNGTVGGVLVANEDIVVKNGPTFSLYFDGSDVGLASSTIDAFSILNETQILLSFSNSATLSGIGFVDDSDIVRFNATSLGDTTAGTFEFFFDASDVGLSTNSEDTDAVELLSNGHLLLSTSGSLSTSSFSATAQDIVEFVPAVLGDTTAGNWSMYLDGSDVQLSTSAENIDAFALDSAGQVYLSTSGSFFVTGLSGADEDIFIFNPTSLRDVTAGTYNPALFFDGSLFGLQNNDVFAIDLP